MAGDVRLGSVLRGMREARGISLKAAAECLGTKRHATISEIETGRRGVSFSEVVKLAGFYGMTLAEVLRAAGEDGTDSVRVAVPLARATGDLCESDRIAIARMERLAKDLASLKSVLGS